MSEKDNGGPAFPIPGDQYDESFNGMTLRDFFIAHAPTEPQPWFQPVMSTPAPEQYSGACYEGSRLEKWHEEWSRQRYIQWPSAWADAMLEARQQ